MLKKNTAVTGFWIGNFISTTDGSTVTTGTPTCKRTLDGTSGACANAAAYDEAGLGWKIDLAAGDMNGDMVGLSFTLTGCLPISYTISTTTKLVSDLNDIAAGAAMTLADDAITAAKFDETSAFPLKSADTGATAVARTGADADTLETLSDQLDTIEAASGADPWNTDLPGAYAAGKAGYILGTNLDAQVSAVHDDLETLSVGNVASIVAVTDKLDTALEADGDVYRFTVNGLENAPTAMATTSEIAAAVDDVLTVSHGSGLWTDATTYGTGAVTFTYTLTSTTDASPIVGADVWVSTDEAGVTVVANGVTDAFGQVVFYLDAGTYHFWRQLAGYNFDNPDTEIVGD